RVRGITPDSMAYIDVARHLRGGQGLSTGTLGFNQQHLDVARTLPAPFVSQAPLYPLTIAVFSWSGLEPASAALLVAAVAWWAIVLLGYVLTRRAYGETAARLAVALLVLWPPLRQSAYNAWSETLGVALTLASLLALAPRRPEDGPTGAARAGLAGA